MIPLEVVIDRAGRTPLRLTPAQDTLRFSTNAVGGFASCSFSLPGDPARWKRELPHLGTVRLILDTAVVWEGELQDITLKLGGDLGATVNCIGVGAALLGRTSVRRIWSKRDNDWTEAPGGLGVTIPINVSGGVAKANMEVAVGAFELADLTKVGVRIAGNGVAVAAAAGHMAWQTIPGATIQRVMGTVTLAGANTGAGKFIARVWAWNYGSTAALDALLDTGTTGSFNVTPSSRDSIALGSWNANAGSLTPTNADKIDFTDVRLLATSLTEDASGGFYGGTILNDLVGLVPGLTVGVIETGSDFTISAIERAVRTSALDIVNEVAGYYTREWRVWENGSFDWKAVNKDEPQWIARLADLDSGSELTATIDGLAQTQYILYTDAASGLNAEASSTSTAQRNPFVKQGKTSDVLSTPGFPMTSTTSGQLASRIVSDEANYPSIQGRIVLPATKLLARATGTPLPAIQIRGGDNIIVSDLPKTDLFAQGRDGETLFHVVSTECDLEAGNVTLEVEGQTRRADVLLARLAAVTRTITG